MGISKPQEDFRLSISGQWRVWFAPTISFVHRRDVLLLLTMGNLDRLVLDPAREWIAGGLWWYAKWIIHGLIWIGYLNSVACSISPFGWLTLVIIGPTVWAYVYFHLYFVLLASATDTCTFFKLVLGLLSCLWFFFSFLVGMGHLLRFLYYYLRGRCLFFHTLYSVLVGPIIQTASVFLLPFLV